MESAVFGALYLCIPSTRRGPCREEQLHKDRQEMTGGTWNLPWILQSRELGKSYLTSQEVLRNLCYLSLWSAVNEMNIHLLFAPSYNEGWEMLCLNMLYRWLRFPPTLHLLPLFLLFPYVWLFSSNATYLGCLENPCNTTNKVLKLKQAPSSAVLYCQIKGYPCLSKTYQEVQMCIDHLCPYFGNCPLYWATDWLVCIIILLFRGVFFWVLCIFYI